MTCDRQVPTTPGWGRPKEYCSDVCRRTARNGSHERKLPDVGIPMRVWHAIADEAAEAEMTPLELIHLTLLDEFG